MQTELARVKATLEVEEDDTSVNCKVYGKAKWKDKAKFNSYDDHRMAMALTPLGCLHPVTIKDPAVVSKSYPGFWRDVESVGLKIEKQRL
jgi:3-phosphoshikimate 1-carboxyvinyltransferase